MFIDDDEGTNDAAVTNQVLIDTQERLGALLDLMPTGLVIHQAQGILYANKQAQKLFRKDEFAIVGSHILDYFPDDTEADENIMLTFMRSFGQKEPLKMPNLDLKYPDGTSYNLKVTTGSLPWEGTPVVQILLEDVTEIKQQADELRKLSLHDPMTGAYNRRFFISHAEEQVQISLKQEKNFSLLIFDLDHFKKVNDTYGHLAGDEALKSIVNIWNENTRHNPENGRKPDGTLARIGGEEFAIILENTDEKTASIIAERLRRAFAKNIVKCGEIEFKITASFGLTSLLFTDKSIDDLIRRADFALYSAKDLGRNRVEIY